MSEHDARLMLQAYAMAYERLFRQMANATDDAGGPAAPEEPATPVDTSLELLATRVQQNWTYAIAVGLLHGTLVEGSDAFEHLLTQAPEWPDREHVLRRVRAHIEAQDPVIESSER